jgi:hypothetical protein
MATLAGPGRRGDPAPALLFQPQDVARHVGHRDAVPCRPPTTSCPIPSAPRRSSPTAPAPSSSSRPTIPPAWNTRPRSSAPFSISPAPGLALILDETYRDFLAEDGAPHDLFAEPDWDDTLIHLYSFSKAYRLTGHRVGALMWPRPRGWPRSRNSSTPSRSAPRRSARSARSGGCGTCRTGSPGERAEILARRDALIAGFQRLPGWELLGCGAYFAYARHPFDAASDVVAKDLVDRAHILTLPGTMFGPRREVGRRRAGRGHAPHRLRQCRCDRPGRGLRPACGAWSLSPKPASCRP